MNSSPFSIVTLPQIGQDASETAAEKALVDRYRSFRLSGLQSDPEAFASSYLEESQKDFDFWKARLSNPKAVNFIAIPSSPISMRQDPIDAAKGEEWMGMIVMLGPEEPGAVAVSANVSPWETLSSDRPGIDDAQVSKDDEDENEQHVVSYHFAGTFTMPDARRRGVGAALFYTALREAEDGCRELGAQMLRCTIHVEEDNLAARKLYEKAGFVKVSEEKYTPRPTEAGSRPERTAFIMQLRKELS